MILTFSSQSSVVVGLAAAGILSHDTVSSFGTFAKTGASLSDEEIRCVADVVFPHASVAVHVLITTVPDTQPASPPSVVSSNVIVTFASQLSVAVTLIVPLAGKASPHAASVSAGTPTKTGAAVSSTVMICVSSVELPQLSVTDHVLTRT